MSDLLFVYGSLLSRGSNHRLLVEQGAVLFSPSAQVKGQLYQIDWYPGYVPNENGSVIGEVYQLPHPETAFRQLDQYEECDHPTSPEYRRILIPAHTEKGILQCWTYEYLHEVSQSPLIPSGDFIAYLNAQKSDFH